MSTVRREYVGLGLDVTDIFKYEDYDRVETELTKRGLDITDTNSMGDGRDLIFFHLAKSDYYEGFKDIVFKINGNGLDLSTTIGVSTG